ncbi:CFF_HP2_G0007180.mRNA.1.CDS.1 [Saccharomyces cerevisiae]|nr:CFF_HP2_G0007180.mRNA.1.CDS.1 [Saccharomyces cerevisiae]CAI6405269.1 CFF_HP2_G0007180.mRNA.1.CDS.1 [Saccharomyces cerevisiae]
MHKGASQWKITTGESRCRNRQIGGKTWSPISSLFSFERDIGFCPTSPIRDIGLIRGVLRLAGKNFLCKRGYSETVTEGKRLETCRLQMER